MAVRTNNLGDDGTGQFPWAEMDHVHAGDSYVIRLTAIPPYRDQLTDELNCHIDWTNLTQGTNGRWSNVLLEAKVGPEGRRGPMLRYFNTHI
jgi:hypothetical protein